MIVAYFAVRNVPILFWRYRRQPFRL